MNLRHKIMSGAMAVTMAAGALAAQTAPAPTPGTNPPAQHQRHRGGKHMMFGKMAQALNLTDAQKQFAKQLFQENRQANQGVREQLKANHEQLTAAIKANNSAEIDRLTATQAQLRGQMAASRAKAMAKFYAQLTPEQQTKADQLQMQFRNHRMNRGQAHERTNG